MKITIYKSVKRVLSLCLAMALIIGTLFTANIGVNIVADAATGISEYTGEEKEISLLDPSQPNSESNPYIIANANQMYNFMVGNSTSGGVAIDTTGKYFKVADGIKAFYMNGGATVAAMTTPEQIKEYFEVTNTGYKKVWSAADRAFKGHFDGNGVTVYGIGGDGANNGLFPFVAGDVTIKNVTVKNSYFAGSTAGGLVGSANVSIAANSITAENCAVINNYIAGGRGDAGGGGLFGFLYNGNSTDSYPELHVNNCIVHSNAIIATNAAAPGGFALAGSMGGNRSHMIANSILLGGDGLFNSGSHWAQQPQFYQKIYTDADLTSVGTYAAGVIETIDPEAIKGKSGKAVMALLNWATDEANGYGYWHVIANDYPTPIKPENWADIVSAPVWSGNTADFTKGTGTETDPYIIETPDQLYKMVRDGGKTNGGNSYYKVADSVTDLYLNNVEGGTIDSLKSLASAGVAKNWSKDFDSETYRTEDTNADGVLPAQAFTGYFDGNGVTIHGLYSAVKNNYTWGAYPIGFVPAMLDNAIIKNVTFDCSYIYNISYYYASVITTNVYTEEPNCDVNVALYNVAVRNSHIETTYSNDSTYFGSAAGLVASHGNADRLSMVNCLFDGTTSVLKADKFTYDMRAGIATGSQDMAHYYMLNCVSLGYPVVPQPEGVTMNSYAKATANSFDACYQTISDTHSTGVNVISEVSDYTKDMLPLLNWSQWSLIEVETGDTLPIPTGITKSNIAGYTNFVNLIESQTNGVGNYSYAGSHPSGTFGHYQKLVGSGTKEDPYLISTALQLANAISTGGKNINQKLYYKLTNDIDLGGIKWIDTKTRAHTSGEFNAYVYTPFEGTLDGDGYTVYGLYANNDESAGLIPVLDGGTVKNIHLRDVMVISGEYAGALVGDHISGEVTNCSAENAMISSEEIGYLIGADIVSVPNSYFLGVNGEMYYTDANENPYGNIEGVTDPMEDFLSDLDTSIWYIGGKEGSLPRLRNRAAAMENADIDGDGKSNDYSAADLIALKNKLLKKADFANIYGDVSKDGKTNSGDLVALTRSIAGDYNHIKDGFWRNLALDNFEIYYGENDNYDAARKLELYLESAVPGIDIGKVVSADNTVSGANYDKSKVYVHANDSVGTPDGKLEIIVGNIANYSAYATNQNATAANSYAITYDKENGVLWLQGENFTAVEQAVLDFIAGSDVKTNALYTIDNATLSPDKAPVTIGDKTYYYAWGDEFSGTELSEDIWNYGAMGTETTYESTGGGKYKNLENAFNSDLDQLYVVEGGKLSVKRGVYGTSSWADGYVGLEATTRTNNEFNGNVEADDKYVSAGLIQGENSLLVKQGYFEFKASLPSDGHSFMSWWMMGTPSGGNNNAYTESLYGKIYKLNPNFAGDNKMDGSNPGATFKYQVPQAYFEIDIIELMQDITNFGASWSGKRYSQLTGVYDYVLPFNLHKYYDTGVTEANVFYPITWNNDVPTLGTQIPLSKMGGDDWYLSTELGSHDFGNKTNFVYNADSQIKLTAMRRYGFLWEVQDNNNNGKGDSGDTFSYTLYIWDPAGDGEADANDYKSYTFTDITYQEASNTSYEDTISDVEVANQYMHFLIDNTFYAANEYKNGSPITSGTATEFTDLLTKENNDKTSLDIEYLRVYQADNRRDIITQETEHFNNGNHFGY